MTKENIPINWCEAKLGEVANQITKGTTPTTAGYQYLDSGIPFIKIENINQHGIDLDSVTQFISEEANTALLRSQLEEGDILFSIAGTIGKTALVTKECLPANTNQAVAIIRGTSGIFDAKYLRQQLRNSADVIAKNNARGGAMNNISLGDLKEISLSIPSFAEQQQIAAKLDELLAQVDSIKTRLDVIPKILKHFRQSVLAAAVSGKLTEDWRQSADQFDVTSQIEAILTDRQTISGNKKKPVNHLINEEFEIPSGWKWVSLDALSAKIVDGTHHTPTYVENGVPFISVKDIKNGNIDFSDTKFITKEEHEELCKRCNPEIGDLLITKSGTIGRTAIVNTENEFSLFVSVALIKPASKKCNMHFINLALQKWVNEIDVSSRIVGSAIKNLHLVDMRVLAIPFPSIQEQTEIVRRVEQLFAYAGQIEQRVKDAQARVKHLTQSILAKAFRGELTADWRAQNPKLISGENSAEALLAKIQKERPKEKPRTDRKARA